METPWYEEGLRFECSQCGNCCRNHGEYGYVYLMPPEVTAATWGWCDEWLPEGRGVPLTIGCVVTPGRGSPPRFGRCCGPT